MALTRRNVLLAKDESTYNTDPTPSAANDAVLVENLAWGPVNQRMIAREHGRTSLAPVQQIYGGTLWQITFDIRLKGSGTAGTAPEFGPLLKACGMSETIVASTSVTYEPASSSIGSCTIYVYEDGKLYPVTGCRGTFTFEAAAGDAAKLSFTMTGHLGTHSDAALPAPTLDATDPVAFLGASTSILGYSSPVFEMLSFDMQNNVIMPSSANATDGYGEILIEKRNVVGSINPEDVAKATKDWIGEWKAGTSGPLQTGVIGSTAGNRWQVSFPDAYYIDVLPGDREGIRTVDLNFKANEPSGDDEVSIVLT